MKNLVVGSLVLGLSLALGVSDSFAAPKTASSKSKSVKSAAKKIKKAKKSKKKKSKKLSSRRKRLLLAQASQKKAQAKSAAGSSTAKAEERSSFRLSYWGEFYGPSVTAPFDSTTPSSSGAVDAPLNSYNTITPSYQVNKNLNFNVTARFTTYFAKEVIGDEEQSAGFELLDPRVGVKMTSIAGAGRWKFSYLWTGFEIPVTDGSINASGSATGNSKMMAIRSVQINTFDIGNGFDMGLWTIEKATFYRSTGGNPAVASFYVAPWVRYKFSDKFNTLWAVENAFSVKADGTYAGDPTYVRTLFYYAPIKGLELGPYFKFYPGILDSDNMSLGLELAASLF